MGPRIRGCGRWACRWADAVGVLGGPAFGALRLGFAPAMLPSPFGRGAGGASFGVTALIGVALQEIISFDFLSPSRVPAFICRRGAGGPAVAVAPAVQPSPRFCLKMWSGHR